MNPRMEFKCESESSISDKMNVILYGDDSAELTVYDGGERACIHLKAHSIATLIDFLGTVPEVSKHRMTQQNIIAAKHEYILACEEEIRELRHRLKKEETIENPVKLIEGETAW